jgi:prepilin signal peptidase PulO-like enzyme (type II secretory pathway)
MITCFILITGLVFGSFASCVSWRLPRKEDIVIKPSHCPKCLAKLGFKDLWPVLSWLSSQGKCRHCDAAISSRYPLIEMATAALFFLIYSYYGLTWLSALLALLAVVLLILIVIDLEHYLIPNEIQLAVLALGVAWRFLLHSPVSIPLIGFAVGAAIGLTLHYGYRLIRKKDGLGLGDVKFLAVAGVWLGAMPMVPFLFYASVLGIVFGLLWRALGKGPVFPFGPALATSLFLCIVFPENINLFWNMWNM